MAESSSSSACTVTITDIRRAGRAVVAALHPAAAGAAKDSSEAVELTSAGQLVRGDTAVAPSLPEGSSASSIAQAVVVDDPPAVIMAHNDGTITRRPIGAGADAVQGAKVLRWKSHHKTAPLIGVSNANNQLWVVESPDSPPTVLDAITLQPSADEPTNGLTDQQNAALAPIRCLVVAPWQPWAITAHVNGDFVSWKTGSGSDSAGIRPIWSSVQRHSGEPNAARAAAASTCVAIAPDNSLLACNDATTGELIVMDTVSMGPFRTFNPRGASGAAATMSSVVFSPTQFWIACAIGPHVVAYDMTVREEQIPFIDTAASPADTPAHVTTIGAAGTSSTATITSLAFAASGTTLVAVREDGSVMRIAVTGDPSRR